MPMNRNDLFLAQRAETLRLSGAYEQAKEIFEQLQKNSPQNAWVNAHLGMTYYQMMNYGMAEKYLKAAIKKNDNYLWAHAQLGETYRLWASVSWDQAELMDKIDKSIQHFNKALVSSPQESNYAWALAHLGATYRLKMTRNDSFLSQLVVDDSAKQLALDCLNRAIELIPTYAWAWGMRATVYRLAQKYEDSYWDLEVETVIAPDIDVLQNSSSPVPFLQSRRVNLHEHALLSFYMTKVENASDDGSKKDRHYNRAIAFAQQALIVQPGDLIAKLILLVIEANRNKQKSDDPLSKSNGINTIKEKIREFFEDAKSEFFEPCKTVLLYLIQAQRIKVTDLETIRNNAGKNHKLTQLVLNDAIGDASSDIGDNAELWLWKNIALTEACSNALFLLSDLSHILKEDPLLGTAQPYRDLAITINPFYTLERFYQTPVVVEEERSTIFNHLSNSTSTMVKLKKR